MALRQFQIIENVQKGKYGLVRARVVGMFGKTSTWTDWTYFQAGDNTAPTSPTSNQLQYSTGLSRFYFNVTSDYLSGMESDISKLRWYARRSVDGNYNPDFDDSWTPDAILNPNETYIYVPDINTAYYYSVFCIAQDIAGNYDTSTEAQINYIQADLLRNEGIYANTIVGNEKIAAGSISVNEINFTVVGNDNVIATINASSEGLTIEADNLSIGAATTFSSGYDTSETRHASDKTKIDGGTVYTNTITATQIAANTITASQIAAATITASEIASNTITATQIAAGTITTTEILANTIVSGNIASGAITATQIAAATITASEIAAATITGANISASAVIIAGTSNNVGVLNGADALYRIYCGHATPASAPFRVTQAGAMTSTSGTIGGFTIGATTLTSVNSEIILDSSNKKIYIGGTTANHTEMLVSGNYQHIVMYDLNTAEIVKILGSGATEGLGSIILDHRDSSGVSVSEIRIDGNAVYFYVKDVISMGWPSGDANSILEILNGDLKIGVGESIIFTPSGAPTTREGAVYYDSTANKLKVYNGSVWETITSA